MRPSTSTSGTRPPSSLSTRPSSSASSRSLALRPSSSASISSARRTPTNSSRPASRSTQRPPSRLAPRPPTRQSTRLNASYHTLVTQLTGLTLDNDPENFEAVVDFVTRTVDPTLKPASGIDFPTTQAHLEGHAQKARINSNDSLATALDLIQARLKVIAANESDLDAEIHVALSQTPNSATLDSAEQLIDRIKNPNRPPSGLTWAEILAEEPYAGQHWEGVYGLPPGSVKRDEDEGDAASDNSLLSLSLLDDDFGQEDSLSSSCEIWSEDGAAESPLTPEPDDAGYMQQWSKEIAAHSHRFEVEQLQARQYWRAEYANDAQALNCPFSVGNAATLDSSTIIWTVHAVFTHQKYIHEHDAVREILMVLQGRNNLLLSWNSGVGKLAPSFTPAPKAPSLLHLTPGAFHSILASFSEIATTVEHLRRFLAAMYASTSRSQGISSASTGPTGISSSRAKRTARTLQAFSEAIDVQVRRLDAWCALEEEKISMAQAGIGSPIVCSLLNLRSRLEDEFSNSFDVMSRILRDVVQRGTRSAESVLPIWTYPDLPPRAHPAAISTNLLNSLLQELEHASTVGDYVTSKSLLGLFRDSMAPLWKMLHRWLKEGMPIRDVALGTRAVGYQHLELDEEFFVEDNELVLLDPDFWEECFVLRDCQLEDSGYSSVPEFLVHIAPHVLAAGKSIGLLRVLGVLNSSEGDPQPWLQSWQSFSDLLEETDGETRSLGLLVDFPKFMYDKLHPLCRHASQMLSYMLVEECDVWLHLTAVEDMYLMRRGDIMSNFLDILFARMDTAMPWTDFHFLNTAFTDGATGLKWIDPALVRFSYRGHKGTSTTRTVRAMEGLHIEYAVPFPLTYIWAPGTLQIYCSLFVFVLQIRKAKATLERILMFYAMRGKFSWFINTLLNHICTNVLDAQLRAFHESFKETKSLDEMIHLHNEHLHKLQTRCLLQPNTAALHEAILSILDTTLHFSDSFVAFAGDTTYDISRHTVAPIKSHRSRRLKRLKKNVIGFSQINSSPPAGNNSSSESDSDDGDTDYSNATAPSFSMAASSFVDEDEFVVRLDTMSNELDASVRFIRRGVESLASGNGEAASAFEMFAFALEDWDQ
ncbi:Spc98 family-domain-containing protein [Cytidiella melzeri]|nr:Spc98 family-domain-containing protein [Cytidiella melzeri]